MTRVTHIHVHADIFKFEMISYFIFTLSIKRAVQIKGKRRERKKENNIELLKNN